MANHFDSNGNPNGWMDHTLALVFMTGMGVLALLIAPGWGRWRPGTRSDT